MHRDREIPNPADMMERFIKHQLYLGDLGFKSIMPEKDEKLELKYKELSDILK